jgi:hypothetical protein
MGTQKNTRKSLRALVYIDVSFRLACVSVHAEKVINISVGGALIICQELPSPEEFLESSSASPLSTY